MVQFTKLQHMPNGELVGAPFVSGIHGLRSSQIIRDVLLRQIRVFPQIPDSLLIVNREKTPPVCPARPLYRSKIRIIKANENRLK